MKVAIAKTKNNKKRGFTLIEFMIVTAIILTVLAVAVYFNMEKARITITIKLDIPVAVAIYCYKKNCKS